MKNIDLVQRIKRELTQADKKIKVNEFNKRLFNLKRRIERVCYNWNKVGITNLKYENDCDIRKLDPVFEDIYGRNSIRADKLLGKKMKNLKKRIEEKDLIYGISIDTGAVIDLQRKMGILGCIDFIYGLSENYFIIMPDLVYKEIREHHEFNLINDKPEISGFVFDMIKKLHQDYVKSKNKIKYKVDAGIVEHDVYWAMLKAFAECEKKGTRDPISVADKELLKESVYNRFAIFDRGKADGIFILSPDEHISKTVHTLKNKKSYELKYCTKEGSGKLVKKCLDYDNIFVFSTNT